WLLLLKLALVGILLTIVVKLLTFSSKIWNFIHTIFVFSQTPHVQKCLNLRKLVKHISWILLRGPTSRGFEKNYWNERTHIKGIIQTPIITSFRKKANLFLMLLAHILEQGIFEMIQRIGRKISFFDEKDTA
ncbi:hypothetical protein ACJX0J_012340, partial [Zea mays]